MQCSVSAGESSRKEEYILSRQGSSLFSNQNSKKEKTGRGGGSGKQLTDDNSIRLIKCYRVYHDGFTSDSLSLDEPRLP